MKKNIVIALALLIALSVAAVGISKIANVVEVAEDISLEEIQDCKTVYWNETQDIMGICGYYYNVTTCADEPMNTSCQTEELYRDYDCVTGTQVVEKNKEVCNDKEFEITIEKLLGNEKYKLEYGDWGKCSYLPGEKDVTIFCDSRLDGNNDGTCQKGESCIAFSISKTGVIRLLRNSREDFSLDDETFRQEKLSLEVIE